jgi:hypothetical protein
MADGPGVTLTGTTPNRLYLWTGTIRERQEAASKANVRNSDVDYDSAARWTTFPERLEEAGESWKVYQNELSLPTGFTKEEDAWLANFTDNPLEWFEQYQARFSENYRRHMAERAVALPGELERLRNSPVPANAPAARERRRKLTELEKELKRVTANGFFREFRGSKDDPQIDMKCRYLRTGDIELLATSRLTEPVTLLVADLSYKTDNRPLLLTPRDARSILLPLTRSHNWYDFSVTVAGEERFFRRFAGRVETGKHGFSDPAMA